jgi:hypothetical protein
VVPPLLARDQGEGRWQRGLRRETPTNPPPPPSGADRPGTARTRRQNVDRTEDRWLSFASLPRIANSVASVPAAAGYVSLGAAVLLGRSIGHVLRTASRALDRVSANTAQMRAIYSAMRRAAGSPPGEPGAHGAAGDGLVETQLASESQWIIWLDERAAVEWAAMAVRFEMERGVSEEPKEDTTGRSRSAVRQASGSKMGHRKAGKNQF